MIAGGMNREESGSITLPFGDRELTFRLPARNLVAVASPQRVAEPVDEAGEIRRALAEPIGGPRLAEAARRARRVVIAADDFTRCTPVERMVPALLDELNRGGIRDEQVTVLIALGTHRPMSEAEVREHFGPEVVERVQVVNHEWQEASALRSLGTTASGTPVEINRLALEADFLIGVGSIVPHHIPGYSGGAKIVQPGISGAETTGATHYLSTRAAQSYLGREENPVRAEIDGIGARVGLKAIFNAVLDPDGRLVQAFYGDPLQAHRRGVVRSRQVFGVRLPGRADIVIAGSHPYDIEFWQAHKTLYPADLAVKDGGTIILVSPCPEGVSVTHRDMLDFTRFDPGRLEQMIEDRQLKDLVSAALALAWAKVRQRSAVHLVSDGIPSEEAAALGFHPFESIPAALAAAMLRHGPEATVTVLPHAPATLPLL